MAADGGRRELRWRQTADAVQLKKRKKGVTFSEGLQGSACLAACHVFFFFFFIREVRLFDVVFLPNGNTTSRYRYLGGV